MIVNAARIFGWVMIIVGILGFVPGITENNMLLGVFHVDGTHNFIHILTGAVALYCASLGRGPSITYFRAFGLVYGVIAVLGFVGGNEVLGFLSNNIADAWLHLIVAAFALYLGFVAEPYTRRTVVP